MVSCVVPDCHNYSEKTGEAVSYHKFPQDHRTKAWLDRVRRVDMPPLENSYVCSEHFLPSCFEIDFRAQLMGEKVRKHLRDDAIPSLFKYGPEPKKARLSSESRLQKQNHKQVSTVTHANFYHPVLFCKNLVLFDLPAWRTLRDCSPVRIRWPLRVHAPVLPLAYLELSEKLTSSV